MKTQKSEQNLQQIDRWLEQLLNLSIDIGNHPDWEQGYSHPDGRSKIRRTWGHIQEARYLLERHREKNS